MKQRNDIEKIIFLDLDHVLTNKNLDNSSFLSYDPNQYKLSSINLKIFDRLLRSTGAKIVISSNWRKFIPPNLYWQYNGKFYKSILEPFKDLYKDQIVDMLPIERYATKCDCLNLWFEDNEWFSKTKSCYAILEDDTREKYQDDIVFCKHLILTDYHFGLTEENAKNAIDILNS